LTDTVVVVPCYNEARRLPVDSFLGFLAENSSVSFVLVDDGSRDETLEQLRAIERSAPTRVEVLALPENRGKAEAVRAGVLQAFERRPFCVGYWDADLATPLAALRDFRGLLEERPEIELVLGARVVLLGRRITRAPLRHYLGRVAATAIALVLGLPVYDTQCGAKLFRASEEWRKLFATPFVTRWLFDVEILARFVQARGAAARDALYEVPLSEWVDVAGSKLVAADYLRAAADLMRVHRRYRPRRAGAPAPRG
jgi:glycosyltransferase involved in cell wall biosynthesis